MYSVLRSDNPQARSCGRFLLRTFSGVISPTHSHTLFQTLCAAFTEICWPQIARARVMNASPRRIMKILGWRRMMPAMTGSLFMRARRARSQYSGFMQRKVDQQVLRLHAHDAFVHGKPEVDRAPRDVGTHQRRVFEAQREEGDDVAHAPLLDFASGPELVQDRGRLGVEADVPRPARLFDLADRLDLDLRSQEMQHPGLHDAAKRIQRRTAIGEADHGVVAG